MEIMGGRKTRGAKQTMEGRKDQMFGRGEGDQRRGYEENRYGLRGGRKETVWRGGKL